MNWHVGQIDAYEQPWPTGEDQAAVLERVKGKAIAMKGAALVNAIRHYGTVGTRKYFAQVLLGERLEYA